MNARDLARRHWGIIALVAVAAPLLFAFNSQDRLASFGDDSASYLTLAHYFGGARGNADAAAWAAHHSHFPPLFPLLLWLSGGASDYRVAYVLVAACAAIALPLIYRHAAAELGGVREGLAVTVLFLLMPTAWISTKGILSESLYLLLLMAALVHFGARVAIERARATDLLVFGTLLACATLTRMLGIALLFAYLAHLGMRAIADRRLPALREFLPALPAVLLLSLWHGLRPRADVDGYGRSAQQIIGKWIADPGGMLRAAADFFSSGWIASFTAEAAVSDEARLAILSIGALALGGVVLRVARNRLDGWFLLLSLGILFPWVFTPDNTRRLLYPLIPLLLVCAADFLLWGTARLSLQSRSRALVVGAVAIMTVALTIPALLLIQRKAGDRAIVLPGQAYAYRDITEYYTTINVERARERVQLVVATLSGLESIGAVTPAGARVMWMRPEYIGLLGHRRGVRFLFRWSAPELAAEVKKAGVDYVVDTWLLKTDLEGVQGDPHVDTAAYAKPSFRLGEIFVLMRVDRAALDGYLATLTSGQPAPDRAPAR
ncbi:MAG: hypothetical protein ABIR98_08280 [Usitatibacter sp.]